MDEAIGEDEAIEEDEAFAFRRLVRVHTVHVTRKQLSQSNELVLTNQPLALFHSSFHVLENGGVPAHSLQGSYPGYESPREPESGILHRNGIYRSQAFEDLHPVGHLSFLHAG